MNNLAKIETENTDEMTEFETEMDSQSMTVMKELMKINEEIRFEQRSE